VLRVEVLETSLYKALASLQAAATTGDDGTAALRAELAQLESEVARLAQAIAAGGEIPALVAAMHERERRRSHLRAELATVERRAGVMRPTLAGCWT
jgi:hypothetical protein